jgi:tetratricopeptide (TPR) repeat protein
VATPDAVASEEHRARLIHHEMVQLAILVALAGGAFVATRAFAAANRRAGLRDAASWYERGLQHMQAGAVPEAASAFRRAALRDRGDRRYGLALARALAAEGQPAAARRALLRLRETAPDDPEISVQLGRLATSVADVPDAVRFYHAAVYSPWIEPAARQEVRRELVQLLLVHHQPGRALPEILAMSMDLPAEPDPHVEIAQLLVAAGDVGRGLSHYERALAIAPADGRALAGAGLAAFELGDYPRARKYLRGAPANREDVAAARRIVDLILDRDPLAPRIPAGTRQRRLVANLDAVVERTSTCSAGMAEPAADAAELALALRALRQEAGTRAGREQDVIENGVLVTAQAAERAGRECPPATPLDEAMVRIGRLHGGPGR